MKKLLVRFFQVLCLIQLFGYSQLNAHPTEVRGSSCSVSIMQLIGADHSVVFTDASAFATKMSSPRTHKIVRFVTEDIDEEEYESISSKKYIESHKCFSTVFYAALPAYLHHNNKNSLAFCKQLSFISANSKHITFLQVFRI